MGRPSGLLLVILFVAGVPGAVAASGPALAILAEPSAGDLATVFTFRASPDTRGPEILTNPDFSHGLEGWSLDDQEIGKGAARASASASPAVARIDVDGKGRGGTVFLEQRFPFEKGSQRFEFSVRTRVEGDLGRFVILLRELGEGAVTDKLVVLPPTASWTTSHVEWAREDPGAAEGAVLLRFESPANARGTAWFADASLRSTPGHAWDWDADGTEDARGSVATTTYASPGEREVRLLRGDGESAIHRVTIENRPPIARLRASPMTGSPGVLLLDGSASVDPDAPELLENGDFSSGLDRWRFESPEAQGAGSATVGLDDRTRYAALSLPRQDSGGSFWIGQTIPVPTDCPCDFTVLVRDNGEIARHEFILREEGSASGPRDLSIVESSTEGWRMLHGRWESRSSDATMLLVLLRTVYAADHTPSVQLANASLRPALSRTWSVEGEELATGSPVVAYRTRHDGPHEVRLVVRDAWNGLHSAVADAAPTPARALAPSLTGPRVAPSSAPAVFHVASSLAPADELVENAGFEDGLRGWRFDRSEVTGAATAIAVPARGEPDRAARLAFSITPGSRPNATLHVSQVVAVDDRIAYDLIVSHRASESARISFLLREIESRGDGTESRLADTEWEVERALDWTTTHARWRPTHENATHVRIFLRVVPTPGSEGEALFDDVSFAPVRHYTWSLDGRELSPAGPIAKLTRPPLGAHTLTVTVKDPSGREAHATAAFEGTAVTGSLTPSVAGRLLVDWTADDGTGSVLRVERHAGVHRERKTLEWNGSFAELAFSPGLALYRLVVEDTEGHVVEISSRRLALGDARTIVPLAEVSPRESHRGNTIRIDADVADTTATSVVANIRGPRDRAYHAPLTRDDGSWTSTWSFPPLARPGEYRVAIEVEGRDGSRIERDAGVVLVHGFRSLSPTFLALLVTAAALAWLPRGVGGRQ